MKTIFNVLNQQIMFWMAWIIIPMLMEIVPSVYGSLLLVIKKIRSKKEVAPIRFPEITVIIPIYNSATTLMGCLESIVLSDYPAELIKIILVNNGSKDDSFKIFCECQNKYRELSMQWVNAKQGKSKALNMAIFNSEGKYIIHIDSDGKLHKDAIKNMIIRFEENPDIHCLTGAVLTEPYLIEKTEGIFLKILRRCELFEYFQAFLAGRNFESELNNIYTISGAFSAFRKSLLLKTQLYNTDTVCEDTQVTFQVRKILKKGVHICENALFFVDPIDDFNKLYTQRQRWQRGEIEVSHMFLKDDLKATSGFFKNFMIRLLIFDHTFAFPRMIWYFALICLVFLNYPIRLVVGSVLILYALYVISSFFYFFNIVSFLTQYKELRKYYKSKWYILFLLPIYNFIIFWIRFAGIINSTKIESSWRTLNLSEEWKKITKTILVDFDFLNKFKRKLGEIINEK